MVFRGGVPEWLKGTDCKSVGNAFGGSNPPPSTIEIMVGTRQKSKAVAVIFLLCLSGWRYVKAGIAQLVEHQPSKLRVAGSRPVSRSSDGTNTWLSDRVSKLASFFVWTVLAAHVAQ